MYSDLHILKHSMLDLYPLAGISARIRVLHRQPYVKTFLEQWAIDDDEEAFKLRESRIKARQKWDKAAMYTNEPVLSNGHTNGHEATKVFVVNAESRTQDVLSDIAHGRYLLYVDEGDPELLSLYHIPWNGHQREIEAWQKASVAGFLYGPELKS
jgi:hypothetical protein